MPRKSWWARLPFGVRMIAGTSALLALVSGGLAGAAVLNGNDGQSAESAEQTLAGDPGAAHLQDDPEVVSREAAAAEPLPLRRTHLPAPPAPPGVAPTATQLPVATGAELQRARAEDPADRTGTRSPRVAPKPTVTGRAKPVVTTRTDTEIRPVPFRTRVVRDDTLPQGFHRLQSPGAPGEEKVRYLVTLTDGRPTGRRLLDTTVTRQPQPRVVVLGTQDCSGAFDLCVPLGRSACPSAAPVPPEPDVPPVAEDSALLDVRLEPATAC
ncbi:hypothetical protein ACWT_7551 [Actinoplanes sp. SE50]|uniref:G5 domain-containing protein n=1 Tax=unclassified Actinoplanes TaxID=2626549 RepID=UPI00023EDD1F|nr:MULTISPECIES: G5 domain-containing protein [unclassified Actinoplanes]AEV88561.1 hypothetical protein ACPL_7681 [Actinoplanes sp. SE50/110]ATO86966.1 hypothetical protein ACWT_7551 [Actinoplanes sp. SE50]SLM04384.1 hypothetical protein ACSP50_7689 [Actinoplanes sp. SE50/110]